MATKSGDFVQRYQYFFKFESIIRKQWTPQRLSFRRNLKQCISIKELNGVIDNFSKRQWEWVRSRETACSGGPRTAISFYFELNFGEQLLHNVCHSRGISSAILP